MDRYVIDTHALLWYATADNRIGNNAKAVIEKCEAGEVQIIVPAIVLIEAISVLRNPRKEFSYNPNTLFDWLTTNQNFLISDLSLDVARSYNNDLENLRSLHDDHDRLVVVASRIFNSAPILTRAQDISGVATTIW